MAANEISVDDFWATVQLAVLESNSTLASAIQSLVTGEPMRIPLLEWLFPAEERAGDARMNAQFEALLMLATPVDEKSAVQLEAARAEIMKGKTNG